VPRVLGALSSRGRLLAYALATLAVLLAAALFVMRTIASRAPSFDLVVEMEAPRQAQRLQATFNNDRSNTRRLAIEDGRRAYVFSDIPADPKSVRLDWVGEAGLRATFYGIEFRAAPRSKRGSGTRLVSIDPQT